jgi:salicylate biosynthesis isochorismate synthase/menaquinone-specific isochorismate synthase
MSVTTPTAPLSLGQGISLSEQDWKRLRKRVDRALKQAKRTKNQLLVSCTFQIGSEVDPSAVVFASRQGMEPWYCFEQPDRSHAALATLGCIAEVNGSGEGEARFEDAADQWRELLASAQADPPEGPPGSGLVAVGGFGFTHSEPTVHQWREFSSGSLIVPELSIARLADDVRLTLIARVGVADTSDTVLKHLRARIASLELTPLPILDHSEQGTAELHSTPLAHEYVEGVGKAVQRIRSKEFEKIVLAREVTAEATDTYNPAAVFATLREKFPTCYVFCVGRGETAFIAASPELLVRREGSRATTVALAGSIRRSQNAELDKKLAEELAHSSKDRGEQNIVTRRICRALEPFSVWVTATPEPAVVKVANIQHLATPIRAQLRGQTSILTLVGRLHPTPAVGAEPPEAIRNIPELEGIERGWYASPVGWIDANEDGEFCVALRCSLLDGKRAHLYAGVGVVADSDPESELKETETKLAALLPLLA